MWAVSLEIPVNTVSATSESVIAPPELDRSARRRAAAPTVSGSTRDDYVVLRRRRIYILPTRQGAAFGGMLMVMLLGSANYNNGLGYALSFLLASLALVSLIHTYRNLAGLRLLLRNGDSVFADQLARFDLIVDNRGGRGRPAVIVRCRPLRAPRETSPRRWWQWPIKRPSGPSGAAKPDHVEHDVVARTEIAADALQRVELFVPPWQRGWLRVERIVIATRYPFGLFRAWSVPQFNARALIYPTPAGDYALPVPSTGTRLLAGQGLSGEDDFTGLREYRPGDSPRRINWKALAREQGLLVKHFSGGAFGELRLRWVDTVGPTEHRVAQLCRWVIEADAQGYRYTLELEQQRVGPRGGGQGREHRERCLRALALFKLLSPPESAEGSASAWNGGT